MLIRRLTAVTLTVVLALSLQHAEAARPVSAEMRVAGLGCPSCVRKLRRRLKNMQGLYDWSLHRDRDLVRVRFREKDVPSVDFLREEVKKAGVYIDDYQVVLVGQFNTQYGRWVLDGAEGTDEFVVEHNETRQDLIEERRRQSAGLNPGSVEVVMRGSVMVTTRELEGQKWLRLRPLEYCPGPRNITLQLDDELKEIERKEAERLLIAQEHVHGV